MSETQGKVTAIRVSEKDGAKSAYIDLAVPVKKGKFTGSKTVEFSAYDNWALEAQALKTGQEILVLWREVTPKGKKPKYKKIEGLLS